MLKYFGAILLVALSAAQLIIYHDYDAAKDIALKEHKLVLIMFTANWCGPCQSFKSDILTDSEIISRLNEKFVVVLIDIDDPANQDVRQNFHKENAVPYFSVVEPKKESVIRQHKGSMSKTEFLKFIDIQIEKDFSLL